MTFDNTDGALSALAVCAGERISSSSRSQRAKAGGAASQAAQCFFVLARSYDIIIHRYMKGRNNKTFGSQRSRAVNVTSIGKYRHYIIHTQTFDINYVSRARINIMGELLFGSLHVSNITGEKGAAKYIM